MSYPTEFETQKIQKWTKKEVHQWLMTQVNIQHTCADQFLEEEVSGEELICFQKKDLLEMGIKHGPAVKIYRYLEDLKRGTQHASQYPAYVGTWTKEQVCQWLLEKVNVYSKYTERLLEEEVSGDCLVCFSTGDLTELDIKRGPAVKIMNKLGNLNSELEPELQTPTHIKTNPEDQQKHQLDNLVYLSQAQPLQTVPTIETRSGANQDESRSTESATTAPQKKEPKSQFHKNTSSRMLLQRYLEKLRKEELKKFKLFLNDSELTGFPSIPQSHLEDKGCIDIADLMTKHYGEEALHVTLSIFKEIPCNDIALGLKRDMGDLKMPYHPKEVQRREGNQGDKLKNLLTCGGNSLDHYDRFVMVMNKSHTEQLEHIQFLSKLKLFCVLDFDPNSAAPGGVCRSYRETRVANLHVPAQFQSLPDDVIKNLNLYKQTSWVFCNGRNDLNSDADKELDYKVLDYKDWFRTARRGIELLASFICKPEVLQSRGTLIIFLLLSPVQTDKDPVFDTFKAFYSHRAGESIVSICESQSTFEKWRGLIQDKCECDITDQAVFELTLSEVNGIVMKLGPHNQPSGRLLPSSDSSTVVLKKKG